MDENYWLNMVSNNYGIKIIGVDIHKDNFEDIYNNLLTNKDCNYLFSIELVKKAIDKALDSGNKELFIKLSNKYKLMLAEA